MCGFLLQVTGQVDDWQSRKGTFLWQNNTRTVSRRTTSDSRTATACVKIQKEGRQLQTLTQMPQPIHRDSEMKAILLCGVTSIHSFPANISSHLITPGIFLFFFYVFGWRCSLNEVLPIRTTGQLFLHSWRHFLGLHLSWLTMAILVFLSAIMGRNDGC